MFKALGYAINLEALWLYYNFGGTATMSMVTPEALPIHYLETFDTSRKDYYAMCLDGYEDNN